MENPIAKLKSFRYSASSAGWRRTLMDVASHALAYRPDRDHSFDQRFGTDTEGKVEPAALGIEDEGRREQAILYLPSPAPVTRWMLEHVGVSHRDFTFVDLGCGKGRVVLMAAQYPFQRVVGVDISPTLTAVARSNVARFPARARRCDSVEICNADVTTFDLPSTNLLLHLYHPFDGEVTSAVLARLESSLRQTPRRVVVAYLLYSGGARGARRVRSLSLLKETRYEHSLLGQYDWLFFSS
ncbi:MAG: class I SAM-dependent methyltransferase [Myxococcales bacterium]|nr:MAG: class I SAM-dependent methyltransferase [Myxococcales bacterium]